MTTNTITQNEKAVSILGVEGRAFAVVTASDGRIMNQRMAATRYWKERGHEYRITVELRFDDSCKNGHESFAITADIREDGREYMGGCCHEEIVKRFPEFAPLIKWHLCSTDGPMHYTANTIYHAGDRDFRGLRKGEKRQLRNGKTGLPCWILECADGKAEKYVDAEECPQAPQFHYAPWWIIGEGKERELDHARSTAIWPEATDAELCAEPDVLRTMLDARLPDLLARFKAAMIGAGFQYPNAKGE